MVLHDFKCTRCATDYPDRLAVWDSASRTSVPEDGEHCRLCAAPLVRIYKVTYRGRRGFSDREKILLYWDPEEGQLNVPARNDDHAMNAARERAGMKRIEIDNLQKLDKTMRYFRLDPDKTNKAGA